MILQFTQVNKSNTETIKQILTLQNELAFLPKLIAEKKTESTEGFLMSKYDMNTLLDDHYTIYTVTEGKILHAFLISYSLETFLEKHPVTEVRELTVPQAFKKPFIYIDQIGVNPNSRGIGAGKKIFDEFKKLHADTPIAAAVLVKPVNNLASHKFFLKNDFKKTATFYTPNLKGAAEVIGTFYYLDALK